METTEIKNREARLRRKLKRRGYILRKSRKHNPNFDDQGGYMILDRDSGFAIWGVKFDLSIEEAEAYTAPPDIPQTIEDILDWQRDAFNKSLDLIKKEESGEISPEEAKKIQTGYQAEWDAFQKHADSLIKTLQIKRK